MKYMMLIYGNEEYWTSFPQDEIDRIVRETDAHNAKLFASGELIGAYGVADQVQAKKVRREAGQTVVTDGPYIEAKEYIGSFYIVDCESFERAVEIAAEMPSATFVDIEIRPIMHGGEGENCQM